MTEAKRQTAICQYLSMIARQKKFIYFSVPNESLMMVLTIFKIPKQTRYQIVIFFKKMGLLPGVSDIIIIHKGKAYGLEVKTDTGTQSPDQILFEKRMIECGGKYEIARGVEDVVKVLKEWGIV